MLARILVAYLLLILPAAAQSPATGITPSARTSEGSSGFTPPATADTSAEAPQTPTKAVPRRVAHVSQGSGTLPNNHGQVWRDYDLRDFTQRVSSQEEPQQAIVDWILRETGYETWHGPVLGILSATPETLSVYHTPETQAVVADIVDRFVSSQAETHAFGLRTITISNPNWRAAALRLMQPVPAQSQGVQAWLMRREDAVLLLSDLQRRTDYREHSSPHLLVNNGRTVVVSSLRPRDYIRNVISTAGAWPGYQREPARIEEGFSLEFSPLVSLDGRTVEAVIKLQLNQVEKMIPVMLEVPTSAAPRQRVRIEVPQVSSSNLHEKFRWPVDQVLVLSMGVVATPAPQKSGNPITDTLGIGSAVSRADALLFVESHGQVTPSTADGRNLPFRSGYPGRY